MIVDRCLAPFSSSSSSSSGISKDSPWTSRGGAGPQTEAAAVLVDELPTVAPSMIRNFAILAHVDHGKSSLADQLLQKTGTLEKGRSRASSPSLDSLAVERERGVTVKAAAAAMLYERGDERFFLHLLDTPGHVDFSYEVSRALAACQGVVFLVDATQGVQAQSVSAFYAALEADLPVVPVLTKIDMHHADVEATTQELVDMFGMKAEEVLKTSAATGEGVEELLDALVDRLPTPGIEESDRDEPLKALLLDSVYDQHLGAILTVYVMKGSLRRGDKITALSTSTDFVVTEVGGYCPRLTPAEKLPAGHVGYLVAGSKATRLRIGDTITVPSAASTIEPVAGFNPPQPRVFAGLYPLKNTAFQAFEDSVRRLVLNDSSVSLTRESAPGLGLGIRGGFLGLFHLDVFRQRLKDEHDLETIVTHPAVTYKLARRVLGKGGNGKAEWDGDEDGLETVHTASDWPANTAEIAAALEPLAEVTIVTPGGYLGAVLELCHERRGIQKDTEFLGGTRAIIRFELPLAEIITDFQESLHSRTAGYASFSYEMGGYRRAPLVRLDALINGRVVDALSVIVHRDNVRSVAKTMTARLKNVLTRQMYEVVLQAAVGTKILSRESIRPYAKDVTAKLYGGDKTRKMKLVAKQKAGKAKMKGLMKGQAPSLTRDVLMAMLTVTPGKE